MPSIHVMRARAKAAAKGGYAARKSADPLWNMSKRELVEIAARLGEICAEFDETRSSAEVGIERAIQEHAILRVNGIV